MEDRNNREDPSITSGLRRKAELTRISGPVPLSKEELTKTCKCGNEFKTHFIKREMCFDCSKKIAEVEERDKVLKEQRDAYEHQQKLIKDAHFPLDKASASFESSNPDIHPREMAIVKTYTEGFTTASGGLIIQSGALEVGTGKTWLAVCIGRMVAETGKRVLFKTARDFLMELRQTYTEDNIAEIDRLRSFLNVSLLILDDVGRDKPTEWVVNTYWSIFDMCMSNLVPVIITTNKLVETKADDCLEYRIGTGAYSRLLKICRHTVINLEGKDLR